jgi:CDP-paratose 2-epimerase
MTRARTSATGPLALITGGAGFIATNVATHLASAGWRVRLFDNLSRPGVNANVAWLRKTYGDAVDLQVGDMRDLGAVRSAVNGAHRVFHFAAQVAVTTSLVDPFLDFDVNARGTLNLLEAIRRLDDRPSLLFTSTNKVYGNLHDLTLTTKGRRYYPAGADVAAHGVSERRPLDFHSPYGCSKGAAEQYVLDYARTFGLRATVFRMSCIYGPHQFGTEDQGWVAHFAIQSMKRRPITLYGDGLQVRDILFVEDLVDAMMRAHDRIDVTAGRAFNIGGGPANTISLLELIDLLADVFGEHPRVLAQSWRSADQRYYVSDHRMFSETTGWKPMTSVAEGVMRLVGWLDSELAAPKAATLDQVAS